MLSFKKSIITSCLMFTATLVADMPTQESLHPYQLIFRHLEGTGIGFNKGYTSVEAMLVTSRSTQFLPFVNLRGHVFNNGQGAGNFGGGFRYLYDSMCQAMGMNVFYDFRKTSHQTFNQMGAGLEYLFPHWELRVNGYFPVGRRTSHKEGIKFDHFSGNNLFIGFKREFAFTGVDGELAWHIQPFCRTDLYLGVGPYYFKGHLGHAALGGKARLEVKMTDYVTLQGIYSYDRVFHSRGSGEIAFNIPFGKRKCVTRTECCSCTSQRTLQTSLYNPPFRNEIMPLKKKRETEVAFDPATGAPLFFVFVDNTSSSAGTFESPFPTLAQAQAASKPADIIYVFPGDGTDTGMNAGITLQTAQRFLGSASSHRFNTQLGNILVPNLSTTSPQVSNGGGVAVTLAQFTEVAGFNVAGSIASTDPNITIDRNTINSGANCIDLSFTDAQGYTTISQNNLTTSAIAINLASDGTLSKVTTQIDRNFSLSAAAEMISINLTTGGIYQTSVIENNFLGATGISIITFDGSDNHGFAMLRNNITSTNFGFIVPAGGSGTQRNYAIQSNAFFGPRTGIGLTLNNPISFADVSQNSFFSKTNGIGISCQDGVPVGLNINGNLMQNIASDGMDITIIGGGSLDLALLNNFVQAAGVRGLLFEVQGDATTSNAVFLANTFSQNNANPAMTIQIVNGNSCVQVLNNKFLSNVGDFAASVALGNLCLSLIENSAPSFGYTLTQTGGTFQVGPTLETNIGPFFKTGTITIQDFNSCCTAP